MRTFATDDRNDFIIEPNGSLSIVSGIDCIADIAKHFGYTATGEQIYDQTDGIPFWPSVFGKTASTQQYEAALRVRLLQSPGVVRVTDLDVVQVGDTIKYTATLLTTEGETVNING